MVVNGIHISALKPRCWAVYLFVNVLFSLTSCYRSSPSLDGDAHDRQDALVDALADAECESSPCDIIAQCGCPSGYMCTLSAAGVRVCAPEGSRGAGESCGEFECMPGLICMEGVCRRTCRSDGDCVESHDCHHLTADPEGLMACNLDCNLLTGTGCPVGWKCDFYESDIERQYFSDCYFPLNNGEMRDECEYYWHLNNGSLDCAIGHVCTFFPDLEFGMCLTLCPNSDLGVHSPYCPHDYPCCNEPVAAKANGEDYLVCSSESFCSP